MTSEELELSEVALQILVEKIAIDPAVPDALKEQICAAAISEDAEQINSLRELIREWIEKHENSQNPTE